MLSHSEGRALTCLAADFEANFPSCRARQAPEKAFRMRADISAVDEELGGIPITRAEAFGSSSASEESEEEGSSSEGDTGEDVSGSESEVEEDAASEDWSDPGYGLLLSR